MFPTLSDVEKKWFNLFNNLTLAILGSCLFVIHLSIVKNPWKEVEFKSKFVANTAIKIKYNNKYVRFKIMYSKWNILP